MTYSSGNPEWVGSAEGKGKGDMYLVPGEIVSKRKKKESKEEVARQKDEYVTMSWSEVFSKKPIERLRWLFKAFQAVRKKTVKSSPLYDIIAHRKFTDGLQGNIATDVLNLIRGNLDIFTSKQQKQLTSDGFELYKKFAPFNILDSDEDEADAPPLPPPPEVLVQMREKKRKHSEMDRRREEREREEEEEAGHSGEELAAKRKRILSKGVERRIDPADGQAYTMQDFIAEYGGSIDSPPVEWEMARNTSFVFKE